MSTENILQVNLGYVEAGVQKHALVKLRVCPEHALQLNYKKDAAALKVGLPGVAEQRLERLECRLGAKLLTACCIANCRSRRSEDGER
jgi:hypothetical protein